MFNVFASLVIGFVLAAVPVLGTVERPAETHCVVFVVDQLPDGELIVSEPDCFAEEATADAWAVVGAEFRLTSQTAPSDSGGVTAFSTFTLGKHYDGFNGTGSSITVVGSACTGGYWNTSSSWDNRISSSYNGCGRLRHWDLPYKAGSAQDTYGAGTTDNLSYMNNRTESVSYHSS